MTRKRPPARPGLDALLGESSALAKSATRDAQMLPLTALSAGRGQPRREFDPGRLDELAASIREQGVLQPLLVRPVGDGYEIVAGERRYRAARLAGLTEVPVVVRELSEFEARMAALIENLQRDDLNLLDEVDGKLALVAAHLGLEPGEAPPRLMRMLREQPGEDHTALDALFAPLGEGWQSFAKGKLRVLGWPDALLTALRQGLPFTLGRVIAGADPAHHAALIALAQSGVSRSDLQAEVARLSARARSASARTTQVSKLLGSQRFLSHLTDTEHRAVERWLDKMPEPLKRALEK